MCEFCIQHGEGKIWYLQAKNYVKELLNEERKRFMAEFWEKMEENVAGGGAFAALDGLIAADPAAANVVSFPVSTMPGSAFVLPPSSRISGQKACSTSIQITRQTWRC